MDITTLITNVEELLLSDDEENWVVGISILDKCDIENNLLSLLLLKRKVYIDNNFWQENAPNFIKVLIRERFDPSTLINMKDIYQFMVNKDEINPGYFSKEKKKIFTKELESIFENSFGIKSSLNWDFIESITIKIK